MVVFAVRDARRFVRSVRTQSGAYSVDRWPAVRGKSGVNPTRAVVLLRFGQRLLMGFLNPVDDALFLVAGLRRLGVAATFHLGRELIPVTPAAGFFAWVECEGRIVSTSLPVQETYVEVHRSEEG